MRKGLIAGLLIVVFVQPPQPARREPSQRK